MGERGIRLQKYLADAGVASRRKAEMLIVSGVVTVNDYIVTKLGTTVSPDDRVAVNGQLVKPVTTKVYIMLHKPVGFVSTAQIGKERGRSVLDLVPPEFRMFPVGRLDRDTSGLLLLTNDGDFTLAITHPRYEKEKEYEVVVDADLSEAAVGHMRRGVVLDDGEKTLPARITMHGPRRFSLVIREGRNRQIRRMCKVVGVKVTSLHRVRINQLVLGALPVGRWRHLRAEEVHALMKGAGATTARR